MSHQTGYGIPERGLMELCIWSCTWNWEFIINIKWNRVSFESTDKAACEWTEYEGGSAGRNGSGEEVLAFLSKWAIMLKAADGLVDAWSRFSV